MVNKMKTSSPGYVVKRAKELRIKQTPAEDLLWQRLKDRKLDGHKFRRQHPLGKFIADFYYARKKLIIEIDGKIHEKKKEYDDIREKTLVLGMGYRIVRFKNEFILQDIDAVLDEIRRYISDSSLPNGPHPPAPSPINEGGGGS